MKYFLKYFLNKLYFFYSKKIYGFHQVFFSQEGEDILLQHVLGNQRKGFYVDIGAHHPQRYSNTYLFYLKGWRGINIDAMPGSMTEFKKIRPDDINLEIGVSGSKKDLSYFIFNERSINTFSPDRARYLNTQNAFKLEKEVVVKTLPLNEILNLYVPKDTDIDFFTIDVEGLDLEVLKTNNWEKYSPKYILIEDFHKPIDELVDSEISKYLRNQGFAFFYRTYNTSIFRKVKNKPLF